MKKNAAKNACSAFFAAFPTATERKKPSRKREAAAPPYFSSALSDTRMRRPAVASGCVSVRTSLYPKEMESG